MTHAPGHDAAGKRRDPAKWAQLDAEARAAKGMAPADTGFQSTDLAALAQKYGISGGMGGAMEDPDDPWVLVSRTTPNPDQFGPGVPLKVPQKKRMSEVLRDFYRMAASDPEEFRKLQGRLYAGGFYPGDVELEDIEFGIADEDSFSAYQRAVKRAAAFSEAKQDVTLDDVLATRSKAALERLDGRKKPATVVADPQDLMRAVEGVARKVVGKKLTPAQRQQFASLYQQIQANYAQQVEGGGVVTAPPDVTTAAENFARTADPAGANEMESIDLGNEFFSLLDGSEG